jgi:hypothetical protein
MRCQDKISDTEYIEYLKMQTLRLETDGKMLKVVYSRKGARLPKKTTEINPHIRIVYRNPAYFKNIV